MLSPFATAESRPIEPLASGALLLSLQKLNTLGSVLYVAAHPDDENTKLIAYLANGERVDTTYLSLTRGDGGQNLIGGDLGEKLGMIRTQELLAARRIDGGQQRFSRAIDFGYSKTPEETLAIWDQDAALADVVWAIRSLRPDVIITRFSLEAGYTHGHHTASARLAKEAFTAAADPARFPEQLEFVEPWAAQRLLWNTSKWFYQRRGIEFDTKDVFFVETGGYNHLLGEAYSEIAAHSRTCHMSQGFGATPELGESKEYFKTLAGTEPEGSLFAGIDTTWGRVANSEPVAAAIQMAIERFNPSKPEAVLPQLLQAHRALSALPASFWQSKKLQELEAVIVACLALDVESIAASASAVPGAEVALDLRAIQRASLPVSIAFATRRVDLARAKVYALPRNHLVHVSETAQIAANASISQPYWLRQPAERGSYMVDELSQMGAPENPAAIPIYVRLIVDGESIIFTIPSTYNFNDPIHGESKQPFTVTPPVMVNLEEGPHILGQNEPRQFTARVIAASDIAAATVHFEAGDGWRVEPASIPFSLEAGKELQVTAKLIPPTAASRTSLRASVEFEGQLYTRGYEALDYEHIPQQTLFPTATAAAVLLDVKIAGERIGYIPGAGDTIPEALRRIGYAVDTLTEAAMNPEALAAYDTVVFGIRALNTNDRIAFYMTALFQYAQQGGVVVMQYNTNRGLKTMEYAPFPFTITRDRVTDETASMRFLAPDHRVLQFPNTITTADFEGWVQERGLYFAGDWDEAYTPIFAANDPGESPLAGSLLIAPIGEGYYVYSGLSWVRQLPAGVPGAYRLFANLMSLGQPAE